MKEDEMGKDKDSVYVAIDSGSAELKGQTYSFTKGVTRVAGNHPLAKMPFFEAAEDNLSYTVEQATAAPAEKRAARIPRSKRSKAPAPKAAAPEHHTHAIVSKAAPAEPEPKKPEGLTMKSLGSK